MDTVENNINENDELFNLSATLSTGQSAIGTVTILDDDTETPPVADEVLTTSNLDTDDAVLSNFSSKSNTPDESSIAFFKKIDIGSGLDGDITSSEDDSFDPADLGGSDLETTESSLVFDITSLPNYGEVYIEISGVMTKIDSNNLDDASSLLSTSDTVYWVATHDQVPSGDEKSIGGVYDDGIVSSWQNDDITVVARDGYNQAATISYSQSNGIGVTGNTGGPSNQLGYDADAQSTESIIFDFTDPVTDASVSITHLIKGESGGEIGSFQAFLDGKSLGVFTFSNEEGVADYHIDAQSHGTSNDADSNSGTLNINDIVFDQLIFSAQEYAEQSDTVNDSSDYFIGEITYHEVPDVEFNYKVMDESNNGSDEVLVKINVATDTPIPDVSTNIAPTTTDDAIITDEDTPYTLTMSDFGTYSDETAAQQVQIKTLPSNGELQFNGVAVISGLAIDVAAIENGELVFIPTSDTDNDSSFTFKLSDGELWSSTQTTTAEVVAIADVPTTSIDVTKISSSENSSGLILTAGDNTYSITDIIANKGDFTEYTFGDQNDQNYNLNNDDNVTITDTMGITGNKFVQGNSEENIIIVDGDFGTINGQAKINANSEDDLILIMGDIVNGDIGDASGDADIVYIDTSSEYFVFSGTEHNTNGTGMDGTVTQYTGINGTGTVVGSMIVNNIEGILFLDGGTLGTVTVENSIATHEYEVDFSAALADLDGSETLSVKISNVPDGASFNSSILVDQGNGIWEVTIAQGEQSIDYDNIIMTVPNNIDNVELTITARATETNDNDNGQNYKEDTDSDTTVSSAPILSIVVNEEITINQTINVTNVLQSHDDYSVNAYNEDGTLSTISTVTGTTHDGFGVNGSIGGGQNPGADEELGFNINEGSETLVFAFDNDISSIDVSFSWKHSIDNASNTEYIGERAIIEFYKNNVLVGTKEHTGGTDNVDGIFSFSPDSSVSFDKVIISANGEGDDFLVNEISYERTLLDTETLPVGAIHSYTYTLDIEAGLRDTDGSTTLSKVTLDELPLNSSLSIGDGIELNQDGSYSIDFNILDTDSNGYVQLPMTTSSQLTPLEINNIEASVSSIQTLSNDSVTTEETAKIGISGTISNDTINGTDADEYIDGSSGSDDINAFDGNDTIVFDINDTIDGGTGYDILDMTGDIDLGTVISNIDNIEELNMENTTSDTLDVNLDDLIDMNDDNELVIKGDNGDTINLSEDADDWVRSENSTIIDGQDFTEYTNTTSPTISVFIDNDIDLDTTGLN
jgi:hypothetical protein